MVIDVKKVTIPSNKKKPPKIESYAWTLLPIFTYDGYTNSGVYQIPLMQGEVNEYVINSVADATDPWKRFTDFLKEIDPDTNRPYIKYLKPCSVVCRLVDGQREVTISITG